MTNYEPSVHPPRPPDRTLLYIIVLIACVAMSVTAVTVLSAIKAESSTIASVMTLIGTVIAAILLLLRVQSVHVEINGRMSALLAATDRSALNRGYARGLKIDPAEPAELAAGNAALVIEGDKFEAAQDRPPRAQGVTEGVIVKPVPTPPRS